MENLIVYKNRTNVVTVSLGIDVSADTITSEIREKAYLSAPLIATWTITFLTDGTDGELILTLDDSLLTNIIAKTGYMDFKRMSNGEPLVIFGEPIKVIFRDTVTE